MLALEGMIRAARLPRHMADPMWGAAVAHPPRSMYDLYNLLTYVSTHDSRNFDEQVAAMPRAGDKAEPGHHARYCPNCRR